METPEPPEFVAIARIQSLLAHHLPQLRVRSIATLGHGLDNRVYEVNGELVVRQRNEPDSGRRAELTRREAALLAAVARLSTVPVPEPVFVDAGAGVLAYRKLPGEPLLTRPVAEPARLAPTLGEFLSRLHQAPVEALAALAPHDDEPLPAWQDGAAQAYQEIAGHLPASARHHVETFLAEPPPPPPSSGAFCHNDLGAEHILVTAGTNTVSGVIDWSDAAITDPLHDLALVYRDLGPAVLDRTLAHYHRQLAPAEWERLAFYARCAVLEDIAYGFRTGARRYAEAGLAHLAWTFG